MMKRDILNKKILSTIVKIQENYPELIGHLDETPRNFKLNAENGVSNKALKDYLDSLSDILETYGKEHEKAYKI